VRIPTKQVDSREKRTNHYETNIASNDWRGVQSSSVGPELGEGFAIPITLGVECNRRARSTQPLSVFLMTNRSISYNWSDAWLLLAIINAGKKGEATLGTIIAAGDGINFAVFKSKELESGLARLTNGGYVQAKNGIFFPTNIALAYTKNPTKRRAIHKDLEDIETMLRGIVGCIRTTFAE
jgi:hypothetical protein